MSQARSFAEHVLDSMSSGVLSLDSTGRIVLFNPAAEKLLGLEASQTLGRPFAEVFLMGLEGNDEFNEALLDAVYQRALANLVLLDFNRPDGETVPLALTVSYLRQGEGETGGVVAHFDDVTELNRLRENERELNERLRQAMLETEAKNQELENALKGKQRVRTMAVGLILFVFVGLGLYSWFSTPLGTATRQAVSSIAKKDGGPASGELNTYTVAPRPVSNAISLSGKLEPLEEVMVVCPFQGKVESKSYFYGAKVQRGELLLELDTTELEIKMREARSKYIKALQEFKKLQGWAHSTEMSKARRALDKAKYDLKRSRSKLEENEILYEEGIIPKTELVQARDEVRNNEASLRSAQEELESVQVKGHSENVSIARMELENAENQLAMLQEKLALSDIKAPVDGIVIRPAGQDEKKAKAVEVGAPLNEGDILLAVGNLEGMTVEAKVDEVDISKIALGQLVKVTGDAFPGVTLPGRIEHISSQAKSEGGSQAPTFDVVVTIDELPDEVQETIRLGMSANLRIVVYENPEALLVPIGAVVNMGGERVVRVLDPETGQPVQKKVTTGLTTLDSVEITSGLSPGDQVILPEGRM